MPKAAWGLDENEPEELPGFEVYRGEKPPPGLYRTKVQFLSVKLNRKDGKMLTGKLKIDEPSESSRSQYNGYEIWVQQNINEQGKPYLNNILKSFGIAWKDFLDKTVLEDGVPSQATAVKITKLGGVKPENLPRVLVTTKNNENPKTGEINLQPHQWLAVDDDNDNDTGDAKSGEEESLF